MSLYKTEFPDYDDTLYCPDGFKDVSYHNDTMPHVRKEMQVNGRDVEINIWQDYKDVDKREYDDTKRFIFSIVVDGDVVDEYTTDNINDIKQYVSDLDKIVDKALTEKVYFWNPKFDVHILTNKILEGDDIRDVLGRETNYLKQDKKYLLVTFPEHSPHVPFNSNGELCRAQIVNKVPDGNYRRLFVGKASSPGYLIYVDMDKVTVDHQFNPEAFIAVKDN